MAKFTSKSCEKELDAYYCKIDAMTPCEREAYLRHGPVDDNDLDEDNAYPDFLDFQEEWEWRYRQQWSKVRVDFLRHLAARNTKIECQGHSHTFHLTCEKERLQKVRATITKTLTDEHVYISTDMSVSPDLCWLQTVESRLGEVSHTEARQMSRAPAALEGFFDRMCAIRLAKQGQPPRKLTFTVFKELWWGKDVAQVAEAVLHRQFGIPTGPSSQMAIEVVKLKRLLPPPPPVRAEEKSILMPLHELLKDHGLHVLMMSVPDARTVIDNINVVRTRQDPRERIEFDALAEAVRTCEFCLHTTPRVRAPSIPGLYYAPPGSGKSYALAYEYFIGVDTDWLTSQLDISDVTPFLRQGIPILSNQCYAFQNSGLKIAGWLNPFRLRKNPVTGRPYISASELQLAAELMPSDLFLRVDKGPNVHLSHALLNLFMTQYIQRAMRSIFMDFEPSTPCMSGKKGHDALYHELLGIPQYSRKKWKKVKGKRKT